VSLFARHNATQYNMSHNPLKKFTGKAGPFKNIEERKLAGKKENKLSKSLSANITNQSCNFMIYPNKI